MCTADIDHSYVAMGPYQGGQAQWIRGTLMGTMPMKDRRSNYFCIVPFADFNCLTLPPGTEHENDFALLADIFPTGWHGVSLSGFTSGESIAIFGAGPVVSTPCVPVGVREQHTD